MSKVDAQRAMREAKWAALQAGKTSRTAPSAPAKPSPEPAPALSKPRVKAASVSGAAAPEAADATAEPETSVTQADSAEPQAGLCGHRSMNNRACTRPAGHPEKNHRYK